VIPTIDFLHYLSQCLPALDYDETLVGATAWNENGVLHCIVIDALIGIFLNG